MRIRNFGAGTPKLNEGIITSGSAATDFHAVYASGSIQAEKLLLDDIQPTLEFKEEGIDRAEILINDSDNLVITNQSTNKFIVFKTNDAGNVREGFRIGGTVPEVVVNEGSDSLIDFRVESDSNTHMLFVDGGNDKVGINTSQPDYALHVAGDIGVNQYIYHNGDNNTFINFTDNQIRFNAGGINFLSLEDDGSAPYPATVNNGGNRINFRVLDRNSNLLLKTNSEDFWAGLYYAGSQKLVTSNTGVSVTGDVNDVLAVGSVNASDTGADTNFFVSGSTRSRGSSTAGTSVFGGDLVVSGTLTAVQKHICTAKYTADNSNREFIRFNAAGSNGTPSVNNKFVTPCAGNLSYIMIRSTGTPGQTSIGFHRATDGTTDLGTTPIDTQNINMVSADTTYQVYFAQAANFGPGDIVGLSVDPTANHGNVDITLVFELDFVL